MNQIYQNQYRNDIIILMIRNKILVLNILILISLNACNTIKGTTTGIGRDVKSIWHYGSCAVFWDKDCQKK